MALIWKPHTGTVGIEPETPACLMKQSGALTIALCPLLYKVLAISYQPLWLCCWSGDISIFFVYKKLDPSSYIQGVRRPWCGDHTICHSAVFNP